MTRFAPQVVMIGSDPREQGGIGSVLMTYQSQGFLDPQVFLVSHREGPAGMRVLLFLKALVGLVAALFRWPSIRVVHMHLSERGSFFRKAILSGVTRALGRKTILHLHGAEFLLFYRNSPRWVQAWIRQTFDQADALVVLSNSWREDLREVTQNPHVEVVYNPVVLPADVRDPASAPTAAEPVRFLFLGRFGQRKGVFDLIRAVASLPERPFLLDLYGDGERDAVAQLIQDTGVAETVRIHGWIRGEAKHQALRAADVLVLPSYNEGLPVAILEALSYGMAVVSTPVGGIAEAVRPEQNGLLVPPGDVSALAQALYRLATEPETLRRFQEASMKMGRQHFAHTRIFEQLQQLYDRLSQTPGRMGEAA